MYLILLSTNRGCWLAWPHLKYYLWFSACVAGGAGGAFAPPGFWESPIFTKFCPPWNFEDRSSRRKSAHSPPLGVDPYAGAADIIHSPYPPPRWTLRPRDTALRSRLAKWSQSKSLDLVVSKTSRLHFPASKAKVIAQKPPEACVINL